MSLAWLPHTCIDNCTLDVYLTFIKYDDFSILLGNLFFYFSSLSFHFHGLQLFVLITCSLESILGVKCTMLKNVVGDD